MGLAHAGCAKDKQGVVGLHLGMVDNGLTDADSKPVADAAAIVLEGVFRVKLGIDIVERVGLLERVGDTG